MKMEKNLKEVGSKAEKKGLAFVLTTMGIGLKVGRNLMFLRNKHLVKGYFKQTFSYSSLFLNY